MEPKFEKPADKAENPTIPTPPEPEQIQKKEEKVAPSPSPAENLSVKAELTPPTPPTPSTPPTPPPTMETPKVEVKVPTPPVIEINVSDESAAETQWQQFGKQISELLDRLPDSVGNFYKDYQRPLTVVGVIIASIIALKVLSGVLDTFNEIPFFESFFQLIGIIYSGWFIYRYLLNAGTRQELWQIIDDYKAQVFGNKKL